MTTVSMFLPSMSGTTGNTLWLYKSSDYSLVNTGGDALSESGTSGWFTADVAEEWDETLSATVLDTNLLASGYGWLAVGETQVKDTQPAVLDSAVQDQLDTIQAAAEAGGGGAGIDEIKGSGWDASTDTLEKIRDAITLVSSISVVIPSPVSDVIGMPETLEIGDSYDEDTPIKLYVRDENDDPVTSFSGHDLTDPDFAPTFTIAPTPGSSRGRVVGTVTWVPAVGPVEGYLNVDIPSSQSRRAVEGESTVQCILKWDGYEKTILTTTVRWLPRI